MAAANTPVMQGMPSWVGLAACWGQVASPLRPNTTDIAWVQAVLDEAVRLTPVPRVMLLGATPELSRLRYPTRAALLGVDSSREMLAALWAPPSGCDSLAICARWEDLPILRASIDVVLADGSFCCVPDVRTIRSVLASVAAAMKPGAPLCVRTFVQPDTPEQVDEVIAEIRAGKIGSVHAAKWRVAMALQGHRDDGVALAEVWQVFQRLMDGGHDFPRCEGWNASSLATLEAYRGVSSRLCFPTLGEFRRMFAMHFDESWIRFPDYELGQRCPTLLLKNR